MSKETHDPIVIIGAGICGLMIAHHLRIHGHHNYILLDKGKNPGGRLATRRFEQGVFDHGAQFFTARSTEFQSLTEDWLAKKWIQPWSVTSSGMSRYCAMDGMNVLAKHLANQHHIETNIQVDNITRVDQDWIICGNHLHSASPYQQMASQVIVTVPVPQALALCIDKNDNKKTILDQPTIEKLSHIAYEPCIALLVLVKNAIKLSDDGFLDNLPGSIAWVADNHQKKVSPVTALTIHAKGDWSQKHYEADDTWIIDELLRELEHVLDRKEIANIQVKRWKYAKTTQLLRTPFVSTGPHHSLIFAGDGFSSNDTEKSGKVETAVLSGIRTAEYVMSQLISS